MRDARAARRAKSLRSGMVLCAIGWSACAQDEEATPPPIPIPVANTVPLDAASVARGCEIYHAQCVDCHGAAGRGDGFHMQHLTPPPSDLTGTATQVKSDQQIFERIWLGGAMPPFNSAMPAFEGILAEAEVRDVVVFLRALARDPLLTSASCPVPPGAPVAGANGHADAGEPTGGVTGGTTPVASLDAGSDGGIVDTGVAEGGSPSSDGGAPDAAADAGSGDAGAVSPMCTAWCACLDLRCSDYPEYPFATKEECHATCTARTATELTCWTDFCERIPMSSMSLRMHLCEHAWGGLGLDEC
jgi:mono/diheme cytochrome c family protein